MSRLLLFILLISLSTTTTLAVDRQLLDLHRFAYLGDLERLETTLEAKPDLNAKDQHGMNVGC